MKKLWSMLAILAALFIVSCGDDYDDTAIKNQINDLENRVANLEQLCQQMNTNISSMQTILNALQERDYITSVTPIKEGDAVIGYTINFAINDPITIYHGKNGAAGKDGYVPVIGVAKFEDDGLYYWTLDGEWLTDAEGNKVRAQGLDGGTGDGGSEGSAGKDGITPQLKIKFDYWYISYDNGATWERLGPATGADGRPGKDGDSFFEDVYEDEDGYVHFVLVGGDEYVVPTKDTLEAQLKDLQDLIDKNYHIKSYTDITDDTGATGYELVLVKDGEEETITIMNGKDGAPGEPGTQITVTEENGIITIVVGEGEDAVTITIPKFDPMTVSIAVADGETAVAEPGTVKTLNVEFTGNPTIKTVICNWPAKIEDWDETAKTAKVKVTVPKSTTAGDSEAVTILVSDGSHTAMNTITLVVTKKTTYKVGDIYEVTIKDGSKKKAVVISINNPTEDGFGTSGKVMAIEEWTSTGYNNSDYYYKNAAKRFSHYGTGWALPSKEADWLAIARNFQSIQNAIEANGGNKLTIGGKYWAAEWSGSSDQGVMITVGTGGNMNVSTGSSNSQASVRAVLAVSEF
ncbi:MAG: hypothetical protein IIV65_03735 [Alistipes sp.]|nr:hypothetical protein [Alistipes sp.]